MFASGGIIFYEARVGAVTVRRAMDKETVKKIGRQKTIQEPIKFNDLFSEEKNFMHVIEW